MLSGTSVSVSVAVAIASLVVLFCSASSILSFMWSCAANMACMFLLCGLCFRRLIFPHVEQWWHSPSEAVAAQTHAGAVQPTLSPDQQKRPRRMSNGASAHMLQGSLPKSKGKTNELIHSIMRIDDLVTCAEFLQKSNDGNKIDSQSAPSSSSTAASLCPKHAASLLSIKGSLFAALTPYRHMHCVPSVDTSGFAAQTVWHSVAPDIDEHIVLHRPRRQAAGNEMMSCGCSASAVFASATEVNEVFEDELLNEHFVIATMKPLWDVRLFVTAPAKAESKLGVTMILRTHHALADGLTLMHVIVSIFDKSASASSSLHSLASAPKAFHSPTREALEQRNRETDGSDEAFVSSSSTRKRVPALSAVSSDGSTSSTDTRSDVSRSENSSNSSSNSSTSGPIDRFVAAAKQRWSSLLEVADSVRSVITIASIKDTPSALYHPDKLELVSKRSILFLRPINGGAFDALRRKLCGELGVSRIPTTEMLHTLVSSAWLRCCAAHEQEDGEEKKAPRTRFLVPFSYPVDSRILSDPRLRHDLLMRNYVGFVSPHAAVGGSLRERVQCAMQEWKRIKGSSFGPAAAWMGDHVARYLPLHMKQAGTWDLAASQSLVFSSVAGPQFSCSAAKSKSSEAMHELPCDGKMRSSAPSLPFTLSVDAAVSNAMPMLICVGSVDQFTLTLTYNSTVYPKTRELAKYWELELQEAGLITT